MIEYLFKLPLQGPRTSYTNVVLTTNDVLAYRLVFSFFDNGKPYDVSACSLVIKGKRSDGTILTDCGIITQDGRAYYDVKSGFYEVEGELSLEVALCTQDGGYITTRELLLNVRAGHGESNLTAQNTVPILAQLVSRAQASVQAAYQATEIAENAKGEMRQLHANAILGKKESTVVFLDDVSPVEHTIKVKVSGVDDPTAVKVIKCGKSLFDLSAFDTTRTSNWNGFGTYIDASHFIGKAMYYQRKASFLDTNGGENFFVSVRFCDENKTVLDGGTKLGTGVKETSAVKTSKVFFTVPEGTHYIAFGYGCFLNNGGSMTIYDSMVEFGAYTDYEPYSGETFTPNADGTLYIPSKAPIMTLYSDTAGANIECEYNRDSNMVIEKLTNAIISLGGNV